MTMESQVTNAVAEAPKANGKEPVARVSSVEEVTRTPTTTVGPFGFTSFQTRWEKPVEIIELQVAPGFEIDKVLIGATVCEGKTWEKRRVPKGVIVTAMLKNTKNASGPCQGIYFHRDAPLGVDVEDVTPPKSPDEAVRAQNVDNAAPRGMMPSPMTQVEGVPNVGSMPMPAMPAPAPTPAVPGAPGMVGAVVQAQMGPPPVTLQPGQQYVQHVSGPTLGGNVAPPAAPAAMHAGGENYQGQASAPQTMPTNITGGGVQYMGVTQQVGGGAQQIQHLGGHPAAHAQPMVGPDDIVVLLTQERCNKISRAMRGAVIMPQEIPAIVYPIEQAMQSNQKHVVAGMNEKAIVLSRGQAQRVLSIVRGTDWREVEALIAMFES